MYTREGFHTNYIHSKYKTWMLSGTSPSRGRGKRAARPPADWRREGASSASLMAGAGPEGRRDRGGGAVPRVWHQGEIEAEVRQNLHCGIGAEQHGAGSHGGCLSGRAASSRGGGGPGVCLFRVGAADGRASCAAPGLRSVKLIREMLSRSLTQGGQLIIQGRVHYAADSDGFRESKRHKT